MTTYHTVQDVVKELQHVEEVTYGTTPASPTFVNSGGIQEIAETNEMTTKRYRSLGNEDIYKLLKCGEVYSFSTKYNPATTALMRYGTEIAGGTGTIEKSLSFLYSHKINTVENFVLFKGARTDSINVEIVPDDLTVTQNWICQDITTPNSAHGLGVPVFASDFAGTPLCGPDTGANPLTINALNYDCVRFRFSVSRNLDARRVIGQNKIQFLIPSIRDIEVDFDILIKDTATMADVKTLVARSASIVINSTGPKLATFSGLQLERYERTTSAESNEILMASFSGTATGVTVTA